MLPVLRRVIDVAAGLVMCAALLGLACSNEASPGNVAGSSGGGPAGATPGGSAGANQAGMSQGGVVTGGAAGAAGATAGAGTAGTGGASGGAAGSGGAGGMEPVLPPGPRWIGRVQETANGARFSWPGTGFILRFNGTAAKISLVTDKEDFFQLVVDGQVGKLSTQAGAHDYDLAQNLAAGEHTVVFWRRTEAFNGAVEVTKLEVTGTLLSPPKPFAKRLELIGDSITVGFGVECKTNGEMFAYATENNYQTYEAVAARQLGAELVTMAVSGIGIWRDTGGNIGTEMPDMYLRTLPGDGNLKWDFARYTPDAVVINLGTNDFATGDPGQTFVDLYAKFLTDIRGRYPKARLYLAVSPMLGGAKRTSIKSYLTTLQQQRVQGGDNNVAIVEFAEPVAADGWGCGHPNEATHAIMAGTLEKALQQDLGW